MVNQYENEVSKVSEKINGERQKEVQDFQKRIQEFRQDNDDKFQKKQAELINPIQVKVLAAIQKVGKAKGFQYILNSESLLLADGPNLTADVKKELGF
jgi:outer membrane protein